MEPAGYNDGKESAKKGRERLRLGRRGVAHSRPSTFSARDAWFTIGVPMSGSFTSRGRSDGAPSSTVSAQASAGSRSVALGAASVTAMLSWSFLA